MTWTTEKPSKPGWYWWRGGPGGYEYPRHLIKTPTGLIVSDCAYKVTKVGGEWSSTPIPEPRSTP